MRSRNDQFGVRCSLAVLAALSAAGSANAADAPDPRTVSELRADLDARKTTSVELVEAFTRRIEAIDRNGPQLRSVIAVNPDALKQARALDKELQTKGPRGPLHGIPVLLKDNIESADPLPTTAGSLALINNVTHRDAPIVANLRAAGAMILGKANLSEWANFRSDQFHQRLERRRRLAKNPHVLDRSPCGSSAGSAVAVAAALAPVSIGTETDGSIVCPSAMNGVVGLKPTLGLLSGKYIVPIAHSQDTAGPMATDGQGRSVAAGRAWWATRRLAIRRPPVAPSPITPRGSCRRR